MLGLEWRVVAPLVSKCGIWQTVVALSFIHSAAIDLQWRAHRRVKMLVYYKIPGGQTALPQDGLRVPPVFVMQEAATSV